MTIVKKIQILILFFFTAKAQPESTFWGNCLNLNSIDFSTTNASCAKKPLSAKAELFSVPIDKKLLKDCVSDICGNFNFETKDLISELINEDNFIKKYKNEIATAIKNTSKNEIFWLNEKIKELNSAQPFADLSEEEKILSSIVFIGNDPKELSTVLTSNELKKLDSTLKKTSKFKDQYNSTFERNLNEARSSSLKEIQDERMQLALLLKEKYGKLSLWNDLNNIIQQSDLDFNIAQTTQSSYYKKNALEQFSHLKTIAEALDKKKDWIKNVVDLGSPGKNYPTLLNKIKENSNDIENKVSSALQKCALTAGAKHTKLPDNKKIGQINSKIDLVKKEIEAKFLSKLSKHSKNILKDILLKTEIQLPPSKESYEYAFKEKIKWMSKTETSSNAKSIVDIYQLSAAQGFENYMAKECEYGLLQEGYDHAIPGFEAINLSEIVANDDVTVSLISHEIFHIIDPSLSLIELSSESLKEIQKIKECLTSFHGGNEFYLSEDWADAGSAYISSDLKTNSWCRDTTNLQITGSLENDTHSPVLLRLLHYQIYKKEGLSSSCKKILEIQKPPILLKKCL